MIADEKIGDRGVKVKCKKCSHMIIVRPPSQQQEEAEATQSLADTPDAPTPEGQMGSAFDTMFGNQQPAAAAAGGGAFDTQATSQYQAPLGGVGMEAAAGAAAGAGAGVAAEGGFSSGYGDDFGDSGSNGHGANGDAPGAASFDSGSGGAFGFEGGASSSGETDFALGSLERQAEEEANEPAASSRPAGEKEWYVAIEDSQVGPIDIGEVEERWDGRRHRVLRTFSDQVGEFRDLDDRHPVRHASLPGEA
ncbi:MAG: MJ0042-type zinc finger domain-containing protein, partial [Myxococcota bacterium]